MFTRKKALSINVDVYEDFPALDDALEWCKTAAEGSILSNLRSEEMHITIPDRKKIRSPRFKDKAAAASAAIERRCHLLDEVYDSIEIAVLLSL